METFVSFVLRLLPVFAIGALVAVPAIWCDFYATKRWGMAYGFGAYQIVSHILLWGTFLLLAYFSIGG